MSEQYEDILKRQWKDVPKEKPLPTGTWELKARGAKFKQAADEDKNPYFMFIYEPTRPMDDVDEGQLAELGASYDLGNNRIYFKMWYETARDVEAVWKHIAKHGVDIETVGSLEDALKAVRNRKVLAYLEQRSFQTKAGETAVTNDPKNFAPVAE